MTADKHPYITSAGSIVSVVNQLRKSFPKEVTKETLQKLGIAPKNESYLISILRFIGLIDENGTKIDAKAKVFLNSDDNKFAKEFAELLTESYSGLFELHAEDQVWKLNNAELMQFFRTSDHSSEVVGKRQAMTFRTLANLAGHGEAPKIRAAQNGGNGKKSPVKKVAVTPVKERAGNKVASLPDNQSSNTRVGLTVRVEVNLPASGDQVTYDRIFSSIRKNFIDGC